MRCGCLMVTRDLGKGGVCWGAEGGATLQWSGEREGMAGKVYLLSRRLMVTVELEPALAEHLPVPVTGRALLCGEGE